MFQREHVLKLGGGAAGVGQLGVGLKAGFLGGEEVLLLITDLCKLQTISFIPQTDINTKGREPQLAGLCRKLLPAQAARSPGPATPTSSGKPRSIQPGSLFLSFYRDQGLRA